MIRVSLKVQNSKEEMEYALPISEVDLLAARKACAVWLKGRKFNPFDGAWGVQMEHDFIRPNVPWFGKLSDFDRIIALHAIADRKCRIVPE